MECDELENDLIFYESAAAEVRADLHFFHSDSWRSVIDRVNRMLHSSCPSVESCYLGSFVLVRDVPLESRLIAIFENIAMYLHDCSKRSDRLLTLAQKLHPNI